MGEVKKYGAAPYTVALLHGGPGAAGEMGPVSAYLSEKYSILEPYQTGNSIHAQVEELRAQLEASIYSPIILAGHSWGAWLAWIFASKYPKFVKKIILISSGPFIDAYVPEISRTRISRLSNAEGQEAQFLMENIDNQAVRDKDKLLKRLGELMAKSDSFDPDYRYQADIEMTPGVYENVWNEAAEMRASGQLLKLSEKIKCPVVAIHGDYDPHPAEGVRKPLAKAKRKFKFILLKDCGHTPWIEKRAREEFFKAMEEEINNA